MIFAQDLGVFFATTYGGIIIGLIFDFHRTLKSNFKVIRKLSLVFDSVFWLLTTLIAFITVNAIESYDLRYYHFVAFFIGFILYYKTISRFVLPIINKIIKIVTTLCTKVFKCSVSILNNLYYVIVYSIHLIFDIIFYIPNVLACGLKKSKVKNEQKKKKREIKKSQKSKAKELSKKAQKAKVKGKNKKDKKKKRM